MRVSILMVCIVATTAHAGTRIVLMTDAADASALRVALAGRDAEIAEVPAPEGALRLDRAAIAQRSALDAQAVAGVWIEQEPGSAEVCVVSSDGKLFRHAPLPIDTASPRVFAAVAASLLDEIFAPSPEIPAVNVDVRVDVQSATPAAPIVAAADPVPRTHFLTAPGLTYAAPPAESGVVRADRVLVEVGPMLSPVTFGLEAEIAFPLSEHLRAGALGGLDYLFVDGGAALYLAGVELRYVGSGQRHTDVGLLAGGATAQGDPVALVGLRLERVWESSGHGLGLSLNPVVFFADGGGVGPGVWTSLRWELPI